MLSACLDHFSLCRIHERRHSEERKASARFLQRASSDEESAPPSVAEGKLLSATGSVMSGGGYAAMKNSLSIRANVKFPLQQSQPLRVGFLLESSDSVLTILHEHMARWNTAGSGRAIGHRGIPG